MRWIKRGLYIFFGSVAGLIALAAGAIFVIDINQAAESKVFYDARPMLRAMRDAPQGISRTQIKDPWPQYSEILLHHIPIGSTREDAMRILSSEGIRCEPSVGPERGLMVCVPTWRPSHVPRWHIELRFDQDDKLAEGRALALKATAT